MSAVNVTGANALLAWKAGVAKLTTAKVPIKNLFTTITDPMAMNPVWLTAYSPDRKLGYGENVRDVVNTIFPLKLAQRHASRLDFYAAYLTRHDRSRRWRTGRNHWGTYFERLVRFPPTEINQLERAIQKLRNWKIRSTTGLVFHLSSPVTDSPKTRGAPCWHFGELLWNRDGTLDFAVVYRNHDFFNKAFGNFIGLAHLLQFICTESGKRPGKLMCHSVHAYSEESMSNLRVLAA